MDTSISAFLEPFAASHEWVGPLDAAVADRLVLVAAWAQLGLGQPDQARTTLEGPTDSKTWVDNVDSLALRATLAYRDGQLRDAYALARRALDEADRQHGATAVSVLAARLTLAAVLRERNELDKAEQVLTEGLDTCQHNGQAQWAAAFVCELIQVMMAHGHHLDGLDRLRQLRHAHAHDPLPANLLRKLDQVEIHCRLGLGDLEGALSIINSIPATLQRNETLARLDLCAGRPDRAVRRLTAAADGAKPTAGRDRATGADDTSPAPARKEIRGATDPPPGRRTGPV